MDPGSEPSNRANRDEAPKVCVYTALIGGYERLNEQPVASASCVDFVCFTDDPGLTSETWQIRHVRPVLREDPARSARALKIRAHAVLPEYDVSLYIDNSVLLRRTPEDAVADLLPEGVRLAMFAHGFRDTVRDEFSAVAEAGFDAPSRLEEQLAHYEACDPDSLELRPLKGFLMLRRHYDPAVVTAMETWFAHVLRYSRRDQLSLWVALRHAALEPHVHELDNFESPYHRWPFTIERDRGRGGVPWTLPEERLAVLETAMAEAALRESELETALAEAGSRLSEIETTLAEASSELSDLQRHIDDMRSTRSWRWMEPARRLRSRTLARQSRKTSSSRG